MRKPGEALHPRRGWVNISQIRVSASTQRGMPMNLKPLLLAAAFLLTPSAILANPQAAAPKPSSPQATAKPAGSPAKPAASTSPTKSAARPAPAKPAATAQASARKPAASAPTRKATAAQRTARSGPPKATERPAAAARADSAARSASPARRAAAPAQRSARVARPQRPAAAPQQRLAQTVEEDLDLGGPEDAHLRVQSKAVLVVEPSGREIYSKNDDLVLPIASITKLMTAVVVLDAGLPLDETLTVSLEDKDFLRNSHSRLDVGSTLSRGDMLRLALMSSENRAAAALARTYPGGTPAFVRAMNAKAQQLGMKRTRFYDSTGLDGNNVSTARDLVKLVQAACEYSLIRDATTTSESEIQPINRNNLMTYRNSNRLVRGGHWDIGLSKTGYLNEAGRCLVMEARVAGRPLIFVLLNGQGRQTPMGDANRIRAWLESGAKTS
jgi:D-alanyl-D-alanine endopeptidase (penicillin-binding protein 7)